MVISSKRVRVPKYVQYVEYIESTGTQYIDTGISYGISNYDTLRFIFRNYYPSLTSSYWLVNGCSGSNGIFYVGCDSGNGYVYYGNGSDKNTGTKVSAGTAYDWDYNAKEGSLSLNGTTLVSGISFSVPSGTLPLTLFGYSTTPTSVDKHTERLYYCQIYENGTLVRDYWPCYDPDGVACLYDKVSRTYAHNAGTGEFIAGGAV